MPGHAALEGNHMTCLALLLRHGADLETKNHNQETLLQCIMKKYGQTRTEKLLEESGNKLEGGGGGLKNIDLQLIYACRNLKLRSGQLFFKTPA